MREIKFRAWDTEYNKMALWDIIEYWGASDFKDLFFGKTEYIPIQYTGLKDKNGKEIYEGDIVKLDEDLPKFSGEIKPITFLRGQFYAHRDCENLAGLSVITDMTGKVARCKIIGNIYENPELIK